MNRSDIQDIIMRSQQQFRCLKALIPNPFGRQAQSIELVFGQQPSVDLIITTIVKQDTVFSPCADNLQTTVNIV